MAWLRLSLAEAETENPHVNSNTVNSKFHLIRSFFGIFARFLSFHVYNAWLIRTWLIWSFTNLKGIQLGSYLK